MMELVDRICYCPNPDWETSHQGPPAVWGPPQAAVRAQNLQFLRPCPTPQPREASLMS